MGLMEWAVIFIIVLVIFGPKSLPKIGQSLGRGIREFKDAAKGFTDDLDDDEPRPRRRTQEQVQPPVVDAASTVNTATPKADSTSSTTPSNQA
jgi:sec-independent protein translocase protein TatA